MLASILGSSIHNFYRLRLFEKIRSFYIKSSKSNFLITYIITIYLCTNIKLIQLLREILLET